MCIRDSIIAAGGNAVAIEADLLDPATPARLFDAAEDALGPVSYTHLRAHETVLDLVCRLLLEKKKSADVQQPIDTPHVSDQPNLLLNHVP